VPAATKGRARGTCAASFLVGDFTPWRCSRHRKSLSTFRRGSGCRLSVVGCQERGAGVRARGQGPRSGSGSQELGSGSRVRSRVSRHSQEAGVRKQGSGARVREQGSGAGNSDRGSGADRRFGEKELEKQGRMMEAQRAEEERTRNRIGNGTSRSWQWHQPQLAMEPAAIGNGISRKAAGWC